jgi:hypothetical protein
MGDMRDYLEYRGDILLGERPFNDVDNLILASLSYLDLKGIAPAAQDDAVVTVRQACDAFLLRAGGEDVSPWVLSLATLDARWVRALGASERLGTSFLRNYVDVVDDCRTLQFSAVCVDLPNGASYVSYRGTDNTLVGWKEDFMLSFCVTDAQRMAADYLEAEARRAKSAGTRLYVGGHSKGGVLAAYAAAVLPAELRGVIDTVWSDDGPGMASEAVSVHAVDVYGERFVHVVPTYDIVGMLFDDGTPKRVVRSSAQGAMQHDPMSWQVLPAGFDEAECLEPDCVRMNRALAGWLDGVDPAERERFTTELFDVLQAGGATTLDEVLGSAQSVQKVLAAVGAADQRTKDLVWELLGAAVAANVASAKDAAINAASQAVAGLADAISNLASDPVADLGASADSNSDLDSDGQDA